MYFQGSETILYDVVMVNTGHYTFVETHRTLLHKERTLHTLILNHFGGHGIPEQNADDKKVLLQNIQEYDLTEGRGATHLSKLGNECTL